MVDIVDALRRKLLDAGGYLFLQGPAGLGKTRAVAELAQQLCRDEGWTVCIAREHGNAQLNPPAAFPDELKNTRVLFVLDDLHMRVLTGLPTPPPYIDRLNSFLEFFEKNIRPGDMYVIATARTEFHHQKQLQFDTEHPLWKRFTVYELPDFEPTKLELLLITLADITGVEIDLDDISAMVSSSDKTPRTLAVNVQLAKEKDERLSLATWKPYQGMTWQKGFGEAKGRWPSAERIFEALHLIRELGLPTRYQYVVELAANIDGSVSSLFELENAAKGMADMRLLGVQEGLLSVYGDEQWGDHLQEVGKSLPHPDQYLEIIVETIITLTASKDEWADDLVLLLMLLIRSERISEAGKVAFAAVERGIHTAIVYFFRGFTCLMQHDYAEAEADFTTALELGMEASLIYYCRGGARFYQEDNAGAEDDFSAAITQDKDPDYYFLRGQARHAQSNYAGAEADFTAAIELGMTLPQVYFLRGKMRFYQDNIEGAKGDLLAARNAGLHIPKVGFQCGIDELAMKTETQKESASNTLEEADTFYSNALRLYASRSAEKLDEAAAYASDAHRRYQSHDSPKASDALRLLNEIHEKLKRVRAQ